MREIALSTRTRTDAIFLVDVSSSRVSRSFPFRKAGMLSVTPLGKSSAMSNPLFAIIWSPGSSRGRIPESFVIFLSLILPTYRLDTKLGYPLGDILNNLFAVL